MITWRRLGEQDFPLLKQWLEEPHVAVWWNHETSPEAVHRDFGPATRGDDHSEDFLALLDGEPFGLLQRCQLADEPGYVAEMAAIAHVPDGAMTIDYLIGDPLAVGQGLGTRMIQSALQAIWDDHPGATAVMVAVSAGNQASWRALEKAGLRLVGEGEMTPDNPANGPAHRMYRIDRDT